MLIAQLPAKARNKVRLVVADAGIGAALVKHVHGAVALVVRRLEAPRRVGGFANLDASVSLNERCERLLDALGGLGALGPRAHQVKIYFSRVIRRSD
jgi:hypothetical protein